MADIGDLDAELEAEINAALAYAGPSRSSEWQDPRIFRDPEVLEEFLSLQGKEPRESIDVLEVHPTEVRDTLLKLLPQLGILAIFRSYLIGSCNWVVDRQGEVYTDSSLWIPLNEEAGLQFLNSRISEIQESVGNGPVLCKAEMKSGRFRPFSEDCISGWNQTVNDSYCFKLLPPETELDRTVKELDYPCFSDMMGNMTVWMGDSETTSHDEVGKYFCALKAQKYCYKKT